MTRKRCKKLLMSMRYDRNQSEALCDYILVKYGSYEKGYAAFTKTHVIFPNILDGITNVVNNLMVGLGALCDDLSGVFSKLSKAFGGIRYGRT